MKIEYLENGLVKIIGEYGSCVFNTQEYELIEVEKAETKQGFVFKATHVLKHFNNLPCYVGELYEKGEYDTRETIIDDTYDYFPDESESDIEELATECFNTIDWQSPSSYLLELAEDKENETAKLRSPFNADSLFVSQNHLESFGYEWEGMLGIKRDTAEIFYYRGYPVYVLYENNTESMVEDKNAFLLHGVEFGIEFADLSNMMKGWLNIRE